MVETVIGAVKGKRVEVHVGALVLHVTQNAHIILLKNHTATMFPWQSSHLARQPSD